LLGLFGMFFTALSYATATGCGISCARSPA